MSLRGPAFILSNHVTRPYCVVTSVLGGDPAAMVASYLKTEEPSEVARIVSLDPIATRWRFDFLSADTPVDALALVRSNLSPYGYYRFLTGADDHEWLVSLPGSIGSLTNVTGIVDNIDEVVSLADGSYIGPTTTTSLWAATVFDFTAPIATPRQGKAMAAFVAVVKLFGTPTNVYPRITFSIRESGNVILDVDAVAERPITVSTGTGHVVIMPFDPVYLADPSFTDLSIKVEGFPGDNGSYARLDAVNLYCEDASAVYDFDTGWLPRPLTTNSTDYDGPQPTVNLQSFLATTHILTDPLSRVVALLLDDQTEHAPVSGEFWGSETGVGVSSLDRHPDGYVEAGVGVIGQAFYLTNHPVRVGSPGPQASPLVEQFSEGSTIGGQSYGADAFRRRHLTVELQVSREELDILKDRLSWRRGHSGAFYFAAEPDIPDSRQIFTSGWWTLRSMGDETMVPMSYTDTVVEGTTLYTVVIELEEKV